jgi:hypothetical protein
MRSALSSRRHVLAAIGAVGALVPGLRGARAFAVAPDPSVERLVSLFKHRDSARAIGSAYLALRPEEGKAKVLLALISDAPEDPMVTPRASDAELRAWLRRRQAHDFANGHVVKLEGWLLSATERRLCALTVLT